MEFARSIGLGFLAIAFTLVSLLFIIIALSIAVCTVAAIASGVGELLRPRRRSTMEASKQKTNLDNQLNNAEVGRRLVSYGPTTTTDELYAFGLALVEESIERFRSYDSKATSIAGYAGAIIALLVSQFSELNRAVDPGAMVFLFLAALVALIAAGLGLRTLSLERILWYSPREWFHEDCLSDTDKLKRFRILTMYEVRQSYIAAGRKKARRVRQAYWALIVAGALLLFPLLNATAHSLQVGFCVGEAGPAEPSFADG